MDSKLFSTPRIDYLLATLRQTYDYKKGSEEEAIIDLVADLFLHAHQEGLDVENINATAMMHLEAEIPSASTLGSLTKEEEKTQQQIISDGKAWDAYWFARDVPNADISLLQRVVIEYGSGWAVTCFACTIKSVNAEALQQVIIDKGNGENAYVLARDVAEADIEALQQVVIDRGTAEDIYLFASDVKGADVQALQRAIEDLDDSEGAKRFANDVPGTAPYEKESPGMSM